MIDLTDDRSITIQTWSKMRKTLSRCGRSPRCSFNADIETEAGLFDLATTISEYLANQEAHPPEDVANGSEPQADERKRLNTDFLILRIALVR